MRKKASYIDFGFDPGESAHHFAVIIPDNETEHVTIEERFDWGADNASQVTRESAVKAILERHRWDRISSQVSVHFNKRVRAAGHSSVWWKVGDVTLLSPYFGKELTLLAWAIEDVDESLIPSAIANWSGLMPEERWWLYTTVNATFRSPDTGRDRGWRKAIKIAFSENPVPELPNERFADHIGSVILPGEQKGEVCKTADVPFTPRKIARPRKQRKGEASLFDSESSNQKPLSFDD